MCLRYFLRILLVSFLFLRNLALMPRPFQRLSFLAASSPIPSEITIKSTCQPTESGSELIFTTSNDEFPHAPEFVPVQQLVPGSDQASHDQPAICHYNSPMHYPHFLQAILRCFSYWQNRPDRTPVLYVPKHQFARFLTNPTAFDERFPHSSAVLRTLVEKTGLQVVKELPNKNARAFATQGFLEKDQVVSPFAMASRRDAMHFRSLFIEEEKEPTTTATTTAATTATTTTPHANSLAIGVVNRVAREGSGRSVLNAEDIRDTLQAAFTKQPNFTVQLRYLKNATFSQQVDFYRQVDVLVSPHGYELTSILFMKPCSAVLELFPHLYYTPYYYSSLARVFGLQHAQWYISNTTLPVWKEHSLQERLANTHNNMCPSLEGVVAGVKKMMLRRQDCLANLPTTTTATSQAEDSTLATTTTITTTPPEDSAIDITTTNNKKTAVVIFTHLISAHPSLEPLLEIVNGYKTYLKGLPSNAPLFITVDGIRPASREKGELFLMDSPENRDKYDQYLQALHQHFRDQDNVRILVAGKSIGLANNIRRVMENLSQDTKYLYLLQHDLPFVKEINHTDIFETAEANPQVRLLGFPGEEKRLNRPCGDADVISPAGMFFRRFKLWTDRNHFARVDHYRNDILPLVESVFPEDNMHKPTRTNCSYFAPYYYSTGKEGPYYEHTDLSARYGHKLAERVKTGELDYDMLTDVNLMVMERLGVNLTELQQYANKR